ncbi:thiol reductant ABC exporter subunit CydD [Actinomadura barringtoniae]|uniref:Thiol reductant ABC exporter subunit CydD n=1 Tax=Actinomadura barringtoniae TaxID=1427535 RepID=A0A939T2W9_9ACTN|nr:thiol reductant ABC exporter subunit CydD [Actinomadura barringtoniae]MBO2450291.1 thiol reductant ABC exporter subunit CydD [Actinomadura barringtoniae]
MPTPIDRRLVRHARSTAPYLIVCVLLGVLSAGCVLAQAALLASAIASLAVPFSLIAVVAVRALLVWAQEVAAQRSAAGVKSQLRGAMLARIAARRLNALPDARSGELNVLVTRGVEALDPYFARYLPQLVLSVIVPVAVLAALAATDLTVAVIVLLTLPLIPLFGALIGMYAAARTRRQWRVLEVLAGHFADVVAGLPTLKAFGRARAQARQIAAVSGEHRGATLATLRIAFCSALVLELAATLSVALVAVSVGLRLVSGSLTFETALFVLILAPEAYLPMRQAAARFHAGQEGMAAADRILSIVDAPVPARVGGGTRGAGVLQVENVVVGPAGVGPFSLEVSGFTALTGPSGIGKTSLIGALMGFREIEAGRVLVGGEELVAGEDWLRQVAWVPQRPCFFAGSAADNIAIAVPGAPAAAVRRAAELFDVASYGDVGKLSAGQRQRVALARAALRCDLLGTPFVILDEPTAHLDVMTEVEVVEVLAELVDGRTALVATHRRTLLERADRVVTLEPVLERPAVLA